jgi:hypothetical protein
MKSTTPRRGATGMVLPNLQAKMKYGRVFPKLTLEQLHEIVCMLGPDSPFVVVDRLDTPDGQQFAQALRRPDGIWIVEYRDGGRTRHYQAEVSGPGIVYQVLAGWALGLPGWRERLTWRPVYH